MVTERNRGGWAEAISIYCKANFLVEEDKFKVRVSGVRSVERRCARSGSPCRKQVPVLPGGAV